jgi:uncharacterized protein (TIGR02145 family)
MNQINHTMKKLLFLILTISFIFTFNSCEDEESYDPLSLNYTKKDLTSFHSNDGEITLSVAGGKEPYAYIWNTGETSSNITNLAAGTFSVTVHDEREESISETITITEPEADELYIEVSKTDVSVFGESDGAIDLTIYGGASPFEIIWSNGETTEDISNLIAGNYNVTVTDAAENSVSESVTIEQPAEIITVTDIDGNIYEAIEIGEQIWMAENLKVTKTPEGEDVDWLIYDDNENNLEPYGRLYTWSDANKVCPEGWHLPAKSEWQVLASELGGRSVAGGKMKDTNPDYWNAPNTGATNESGLTIRAAGEKDEIEYRLKGEYAVYWTSTSISAVDAAEVYLAFNSAELTHFNWHKILHYSVRCVKNNED